MLHLKFSWMHISRPWIVTCLGFLVTFGLPFGIGNSSVEPQTPPLDVAPPYQMNLPTAVGADHGQMPIIPNPGSGPTPRIGSQPVAVVPGQFTTEHFVAANGAHMTYYLYIPQHYQPTRQYPLVLVLHGADEGASPRRNAQQNRANLLDQNYVQPFVSASVQQKSPSFVVVPQIAGGSARWVNVPGGTSSYQLPSQPSSSLRMAIDIVATVEHAYVGVNANRLYITGISMGAYGVWDAVERWPSMFAAAAPIAGAGDPHKASLLSALPIWDFHGRADTLVPVSGSRKMYAAIKAVGGISCYTEMPGYGHDLWNTVKVYAYADFQSWLFAQNRAPTQGKQPPSCTGLTVHGVPAK